MQTPWGHGFAVFWSGAYYVCIEKRMFIKKQGKYKKWPQSREEPKETWQLSGTQNPGWDPGPEKAHYVKAKEYEFTKGRS